MSLDVKVSTERYDIISCGSVIVPKDDYVEFEIKRLRFRVIFTNEKVEDGQRTSGMRYGTEEDDNGQLMVITFFNTESSLFLGQSKLLRLATIENKPLFFQFSISSVGEKSNQTKILFYTWYLQKDNLPNSIDNDSNDGE